MPTMYAQQTAQEIWWSPVRKEDSNPRPLKQKLHQEAELRDVVERYHSRAVSDNECASVVVQRIEAPISVVWSVVRRFDAPQTYKHFVRSCTTTDHDLKVGCLREVRVVSGLPAATSTERLEILDDERHVFSFRIIGGDHRLNNYRSVTTLHETVVDDKPGTVVVESYVVEVPNGNTKEDTCLFIDTIVKCNLHSLAQISSHLNGHQR